MSAPDGFSYHPDFLDADEQRALTEYLEGLTYQHDRFRGQTLKRGYAQFGYSYVTSGRKVEPAAPLPPLIADVADRGRAYCPEGAQFNQCIVTMYPHKAGIGWHTDAPVFGECIMAVSLGGRAPILFRANGTEEPCFEITAAPGSLYVFHGAARRDYQHSVPPVKGTRFSMTFRHVDPTRSST